MVRSDAASRLVERLGAEAVRGDVTERSSWSEVHDDEAIIHAAAIVTAPTTWEAYRQVNVQSTQYAVEAASASRARLVHISSVAVYGRQPRADAQHRVTEEAVLAPIDEADYYARSKRDAEQVLWKASERLGVSAVAFRSCVIFGERERLFMARLLRILRHGFAPLVGSGENRLAMVYAGNVVDAIVAALEHPHATGPFNTTNDGDITQREFYEIIAEATGRPVRMVQVPIGTTVVLGSAWRLLTRAVRPGRYTGLGSSSGRFMARDNPYSSAKAERELGWRPSTEPHEALRRTVRWFVEQGVGR